MKNIKTSVAACLGQTSEVQLSFCLNLGVNLPKTSSQKWKGVIMKKICAIVSFSLLAFCHSAFSQTISILHAFSEADGYAIGRLVITNNLIYGTTMNGGDYGDGVLFRIGTAGGGYTNMFHFTGSFDSNPVVSNDCKLPVIDLIISNRIYGFEHWGGLFGTGRLFWMNTNGTNSTTFYHFLPESNQSETFGENQNGSLPTSMVYYKGFIYCSTAGGGTNGGGGAIIKFKPDGSGLTNIHSFFPSTDGEDLRTHLLITNDVIYGTAYYGGTNGNGTVYKLNINGTGFQTLHHFDPSDMEGAPNDGGAQPIANVVLSGNTLYGSTLYGGTNGGGTIFAVNTDGTGFRLVYTFPAENGPGSGGNGPSNLVLYHNYLYGGTGLGGLNDNGTIFKISLDGTSYTNLYDFSAFNDPDAIVGINSDGSGPGSFTIDGNILYGSTGEGGAYGLGTLFSLQIGPAVVDTNAPVVVVTNVSAGLRVSNAVFTVSGTASDNLGVASVWYSLNNTAWTQAVSLDGWVTWSASISLSPGTNTFATYALDSSGNSSATNTTKIIYVQTAMLTVSTNGRGTITPNLNGMLLNVGSTYSLAAKAATGFKFTNWTDGVGNLLTNGATLKFIMSSNLSLVANFVDIIKPTVTITNPAKTGLKWSNSVLFTVAGKCGDNVGVSNVFVSLNGSGWQTATLSGTGSNWTQKVSLPPGTNTIAAFAVDAAGNHSLTNSTKLIYIPDTRILFGAWNLIQFQTPAQVTLDTNGDLTGGGNFGVTIGTMTLFTNGTLSGQLGSAFEGTFVDNSNGVIAVHVVTLDSTNEFSFLANTSRSSLTEVDSLIDNWDNQREIVFAQRIPPALSAADIAGVWNLLQLKTPTLIYFDTNTVFQGGDNFGVTNGTLTLNANGTFSARLTGSVTGNFTVASNGVVTLNPSNGDGPITLFVNFTKDTMIETSSLFGPMDNQQEIVVGHRAPSTLTAAALAGTWNLTQFQSPAQIYFDTNSVFQGGMGFNIGTGTMTVNANGTLSGQLGDPFNGTFTVSSGGLVKAIINGQAFSFRVNSSRDTMTEVDSFFNFSDNQEDITIAHRVPIN